MAVWLAFACASGWWVQLCMLLPVTEGFWGAVFTNQLIAIGLILLATLAILLWRNDHRARATPPPDVTPAELVGSVHT